MANEQDRFKEIADQLLREDPQFMRRASNLAKHRGGSTLSLGIGLASLVIGFPLLIVSVVIDQPLLGLGVFVLMLTLVMRAINAHQRTLLNMLVELGNRLRQRGGR
jgi:hypothetical protein